MSTKSDKRRSTPRPSTDPHSLPLPLPFPRPLGKTHHRRTQSSAPSLPSPVSTSRQHHRSKSWLANLFKPHASSDPTSSFALAQSSKGSTVSTDTLKRLGPTQSHKVPLQDIANGRADTTIPLSKPQTDPTIRERTTRTLANPTGVYSKPRKPSIAILPDPEQDLANRLASWDWDGGEHLDRTHSDDLDIENVDTLEQSLGTVWQGFLAETIDRAESRPRSISRALSPTSTSPELPPVPLDDAHDSETRGEISFLSLAGDSSLAVSTSTANFHLLSTFPSPSGGEISFTDPFRFADHLSSSTSSFQRPGLDLSEIVPRPRARPDDAGRLAGTTRSPGWTASTLAERRSKRVPSLRIEPVLRQKPSCATSIVSESVYSRYDDDDDDDDKDFTRALIDGPCDQRRPKPSDVHLDDDDDNDKDQERRGVSPRTGKVSYNERSYFSPISPQYPSTPLPFQTSPPLPSPLDPSSSTSRMQPPETLPTLDNRRDFSETSTKLTLSILDDDNDDDNHPTYDGDDRGYERSSRSTISTSRENLFSSLLFEEPLVAPPSSTFDYHDSSLDDHDHDHDNDDDDGGDPNGDHDKFESRPPQEKPLERKRLDDAEQGRSKDLEFNERRDERRRPRDQKPIMVPGWRPQWGFNLVVAQDSQGGRREGLREGGLFDSISEQDKAKDDDNDADDDDDLSEKEVEKRISLHGQRELERRALERKVRWKEERTEFYGEPVDAEYEFGLAL